MTALRRTLLACAAAALTALALAPVASAAGVSQRPRLPGAGRPRHGALPRARRHRRPRHAADDDRAGRLRPGAVPHAPTTCRAQPRRRRRSRSSTPTTTRRSPATSTPTAARYGLPQCNQRANPCFKKVNQNGVAGSYPSHERRLGARDRARRRDRARDLPELQDPARRGELASLANLAAAVEHGRETRRDRDLQQLRRGRVLRRDAATRRTTIPGSRSPRPRATTATAVRLPGRLALTSSPSAARRSRSPPATRGRARRVWSGAGSGCSAYLVRPGVADGALELVARPAAGRKRGVADVAADADPNTGAAVYDTTRYQGRSGWFQVGGTSLSSPLSRASTRSRATRPARATRRRSRTQTPSSAARRHERLERHLRRHEMCAGRRRLRRPDRRRHAERHRRLLAPSDCIRGRVRVARPRTAGVRYERIPIGT